MIDQYHPYLYRWKFTIRTDHASLQWLQNFKNPEGQIARWLDKLQTNDFCIVYHTGRSHQNADFCRVGHALKPSTSIVRTKRKKIGQKRPTNRPNDCVVNVMQTQVSEAPQSQPASSVREGKEVKGVDQPEDGQLSPLHMNVVPRSTGNTNSGTEN